MGAWRPMRPCGRATRPSMPPATLRFRKSTRTRRWRRRDCALLTLWTERGARRAIWSSRTAPTPTPREPPLASARAAEQVFTLDTHRLELSKVERAFIDGEEEGFAVLYTRQGTGEIVGATLVAAHAGAMS